MGIERGQCLNAAQWREKQGLKAAQQGLLPVMQQGKVVVWIRVLMVVYRLREPSHNRAKGIVLGKPMGQEMHAHKRQTGGNLDETPLRLRVFFERSLGAVALCLD